MTTEPISLSAVEKACEDATDGPWVAEYSGEQGHCVIPADAQSTREAVCTTRLFHQSADAELIALSRTALPATIQALRKVLELHRPCREVCLDDDDACHGCLDMNWPCSTVRAISATGIDTGEAGT